MLIQIGSHYINERYITGIYYIDDIEKYEVRWIENDALMGQVLGNLDEVHAILKILNYVEI